MIVIKCETLEVGLAYQVLIHRVQGLKKTCVYQETVRSDGEALDTLTAIGKVAMNCYTLSRGGIFDQPETVNGL